MQQRPDPDELLKHIQPEEHGRGKLKMFLGYAAGVGKTYAMLEAAHQRKAQGVDVVIGYVETHKRADTDELVEGLEVLPRKQVNYHNVTLPEMDVDRILARKPALVLVDEFAHTNAPGSRHPKRFQDVEEILNAGIDVYTTLNIQHLESLNDIVAQVTGVIVRETVPDRVIDEASEIEVIDLPPDELLTRLKEGKVYIPEQASRAIDKFFRKGNLTALREMSLRRAAERVDDQMRSYMQTRAISGPWAAGERLLVCVSPSPLSERLIRSARRLADELNAEWITVYVETPQFAAMSQEKRDRVAKILQLAEDLGARSYTLSSNGSIESTAQAVIDFAHKNNITKIIAGKPLRPRWQEFLRGSLVDKLIHKSGDIDIYVVTSMDVPAFPADENPLKLHSPLYKYFLSMLLVGFATIIGFVIGGRIEPTNLVMVYLLAVVVASVYLGRGPAVLASLLGVLAFDFLFVTPYFTFAVSDTQYIITFIALFLVGMVISQLAARASEQAEAARQREAETAELYDLSRDLAISAELESILAVLQKHVEKIFSRTVAVLLPTENRLTSYILSTGLELSDEEAAVADWVYRHGEAAGRNTNTLPAAQLRYLPLKTARGVVGVLGVGKPNTIERDLTPAQRRLMEAFANQCAQAIERVRLAEEARQIKLLQSAEKLQNALLNSISHDLRTPLVSITGALTTLEEQASELESPAHRSLVETAREEADRLNRLVGNLLDMTRLEAGALKVKCEPSDIQELIGSAISQMESRLDRRRIEVQISDALPLVPLDFVLIVHVLNNLIDNALKYSPEGSPLEINADLVKDEIQISVTDNGIGIPHEDLERVFDKFYRVQRPENVTGTGLGLAICKGIIEAHGGRIWAKNNAAGGSVFTIALPMEEAK
ncbi:MAG TPA: sensor histidine kinase KdpD [Anaerolineales bacterium]|nr:sensor histidine kinase KdpD [Anaerolineales bacterium]